LQENAADIDADLASLAMVLTVEPFNEIGRKRITQLINKSNQFNLTTRRYSEADVRSFERDPNYFTLQARLADRFGDNGMISVVICRERDRDLEIDSWIMSCRVLGRRIENALLREIVAEARRRGLHRVVGVYRPTARNKLVESHYGRLGFAPLRGATDGTTEWQLPCENAPEENIRIDVRRSGSNLASGEDGASGERLKAGL